MVLVVVFVRFINSLIRIHFYWVWASKQIVGIYSNRLAKAVLTCTHNQNLGLKYNNCHLVSIKFSIFADEKVLRILHGKVFIMLRS